MTARAIKINHTDNVAVALRDLAKGDSVDVGGRSIRLLKAIPAKHKFACSNLQEAALVKMYGVTVGKAVQSIAAGDLLHTGNVVHAVDDYELKGVSPTWIAPNTALWREATFDGYHRDDGTVGTGNYWVVVPLVFCEDRNLKVMERSLSTALGYDHLSPYEQFAADIAEAYRRGDDADAMKAYSIEEEKQSTDALLFPNLDGIRFLSHTGGCGGMREDTNTLCGLLAGYINHPNVLGATILSLGCQHAQVDILEKELALRNPDFKKPLLIFEQQKYQSEKAMLADAIRDTIMAIAEHKNISRQAALLNQLM